MTERVRALLITPSGTLLAIRRARPGRTPYTVLPGGGVEATDPSHEAALIREIREEVAGEIDIHRLVHVHRATEGQQYFYLARVHSWSFEQRTGPEFADPSRGTYQPKTVELSAEAIAALNLKPQAIADFLIGHLSRGGDLFELPDLRAAMDGTAQNDIA